MMFGMNVFVLAIVGWLSCFGVIISEAAAVIVTGVNQPKATLAPQRAVVEFTNFTVRTFGQEVLLSEVVVEWTGAGGSIGAIDEVLLIVKESLGINSQDEDRVVATGVFDSSSGEVKLKNLFNTGGLSSFNKAAKFTIAALMKGDLSSYSGQVIYLTVKKLKITDLNGKRLKVKGKLPITGSGHTVNSSLNIGSLTINSEYTTSDQSAQFNITAGSAEPVLLEKIFVRLTGDFADDANFYLEVSGQKYQFVRAGGWLYLYLKESLEVPAGWDIAAEFKTDVKNGLPEISVRPEDIVVKGKNYNYKIFPELNIQYMIGGKG